MIDTNLILDVLLEREPFFEKSKAVLTHCERGRIQGFISASTATDLFYLLRKALGSVDEAYEALGSILSIVKVLTVTNGDVNTAYHFRARDFEDCLLAVCAKSNKCDCVITRNIKDFEGFGIKTYLPEEILEKLG